MQASVCKKLMEKIVEVFFCEKTVLYSEKIFDVRIYAFVFIRSYHSTCSLSFKNNILYMFRFLNDFWPLKFDRILRLFWYFLASEEIFR